LAHTPKPNPWRGSPFPGCATRWDGGNGRTHLAACALAIALHAQGKDEQAEALMRESLAVDEKERPDQWQVFSDRAILGAATHSPSLLRSGYEGMTARERLMDGSERQFIALKAEWLAGFYAAAGQTNEAAEWRGRARFTK